jgi:hypothetical protein
MWLNKDHTAFQARCADPPEDDEPDDGWQPFNYFVIGKISKSLSGKLRVTGVDFFHETELLRHINLSLWISAG